MKIDLTAPNCKQKSCDWAECFSIKIKWKMIEMHISIKVISVRIHTPICNRCFIDSIKNMRNKIKKKEKKLWGREIFSHFSIGQGPFQVFAKLRPGQTLALAEPEARHYNHPVTPPPSAPPAENVWIGYISAISQRNELKFCMTVI